MIIQPKLVDNIQAYLKLNRDEAYFIATAIGFCQNNPEFIADYGTFGKNALANGQAQIVALPTIP